MFNRIISTAVVVLIAAVTFLALFGSTAAQDVEKGPPPRNTPTPDATPVPGATPTIDRLAAPPTVPSPTQADDGAQLFWLHCQPCHGDVGQGLTDEWRAQYPPEDQNCWESGCHGPRPYGEGFTLPTAVPAVIGAGTLSRFQTLDSVYQYVSVAMPLFFPGDLTQEEYLAIVAHLARANGLGDGAALTLDNLAAYRLPSAAQATVVPATAAAPATPPPAAGPPARAGISIVGLALIIGGLVVLIAFGGFVIWLRRGRST